MKPRNRDINIFNLSMMDVISGALGAFLIIVIILLPYYKKDLVNENRQLKQDLQAEKTARQQAEQDLQQARQALEQAEQARQRAEQALRQAEQARQQAEQALRQSEEARQRAEQALQEAEQALRQAEQRVQEAQKALKECEDRAARTFIVILVKWKTLLQDVDLHVIDPGGNEFYFQKKTFPGRPGELSEDDKVGPGMEVWEIRNAPPGRYRIYYNLFSRRGNGKNPVVSGRVFYRDGSLKLPDTRLTLLKTKKLVATVIVKRNGTVEIR
ncbi:MAG: hypothetical protein GY940_25995 [bacterium]|nr:hypothetical protein [bacterium]